MNMLDETKEEHEKTSEKYLNEAELSNQSDKQFKIIVIKMLTRLTEEQMNSEPQNIKKSQLEIKNTIN